MRIVEIKEQAFSISRYASPLIPPGGLNTSVVAIVTDVHRDGAPVIGFGFSSVGRFAQSGLIRERFAPRLIAAKDKDLVSVDGDNIDPFRGWECMMHGEKLGGHGERCVAVGALDMALWDAAAKIAVKPLYKFLAEAVGNEDFKKIIPVYAAGGYYFPDNDIDSLTDEIRRFLDLGYTSVKIKIGERSLSEDLRRIEAVLSLLPQSNCLAVDAMNRYSLSEGLEAAKQLRTYQLLWFEDVCDPLDFEAQTRIISEYNPPIAVGEATFSFSDARNLIRYGGLRPDRDKLVFDPAHCYGLPEYIRIIEMLKTNGWSRKSLFPHGGHLFSLHVAAALGLGGCEASPHNFQPFGGFADESVVINGEIRLPDAPGIGFETRNLLSNLLARVT